MKNLFSSLLLTAFCISFQTYGMQRTYIHVQGDSNSEGMLPGPVCGWNDDICAAKNTPSPWPSVMEEELCKAGLNNLIVLNHSESTRHLCGKSLLKGAINGVGQKDGRAALQGIVMLMMNHGGEQNQKNVLLINLGSNDLQPSGVTEAQLHNKLLIHVVTVLTNPTLQYNLLMRHTESERALILGFMKRLNELISADIAKESLDPNIIDLIEQKKALIQQLFRLINWKIVIIPPIIITGHPFGALVSSKLSLRWPAIVDQVVAFISSPCVIAATGAQEFAKPHTEEWGGCAHFDAEDHRAFGRAMARLLLPILNQDGATK
jgi:hypothetical protein